MATATAKCTCKHCGCEFKINRRNFFNRRSADEWVEWAESSGYYDTCSECYKKMKDEQYKLAKEKIINDIENDGNEVKEMHYKDYKNNYSDCLTIPDSYNPETKTIKVIIPNYDKKVLIMDKVISGLRVLIKKDKESSELYNKMKDNWNKCDKIEFFKHWEKMNELNDKFKYSIRDCKASLIDSCKKAKIID